MPMDERQRVGLGYGTLILIALIVFVFGSIAVDRVNERILELDAKIQIVDQKTEEVQTLIRMQMEEVRELQTSIRKLREKLRGAAQESGTE